MLTSPLKTTKLLLLLIIFSVSTASGQKINDNTIIKDSSGTVYPPAVWRGILMSGGATLKPENRNDPNTAYFIVALSEEEKKAMFAKMPRPRESTFFKTGDQFRLGKVTDMQGNKIDLKNNLGKITVINFWFVNCSPCRREIPDLNMLAKKYGSDSVRFVAIALDDKFRLKDFLKEIPFEYQIIDDGKTYADRYGVTSYPTHVIVDQEGKIYFHTTGLSLHTAYWIEKSIKELMNKPFNTSVANH